MFSAVSIIRRSVTWPSARNSETTRITIAGEVDSRITATESAVLNSDPVSCSSVRTATKAAADSARLVAGSQELHRKLNPRFVPEVSFYRIKRITTHTSYDISSTTSDLGYRPDNDLDAQLEATYEGPEAVQRLQLSITMTNEVFLAQFRQWIEEMRSIASSHPGTGACTLGSAMQMWLWTLLYLQRRRQISAADVCRPRTRISWAQTTGFSCQQIRSYSVRSRRKSSSMYTNSPRSDWVVMLL